MCGRVIQSCSPIRLAILEGLDVRDSRVHNYPPKSNGAPSQELLVIRRNHATGKVSVDPLRWGLIEELTAVPQRSNAKLLQVLRRQLRQDHFVDLIFAECRLVLCEAKAPQPSHNVHDGGRSRSPAESW
jgi:putative SOS response-associated peptidase YedK